MKNFTRQVLHKIKISSIIVLLSGITSIPAQAQWAELTSSHTAINKRSFFRIHYDNDYFTKTDYYYSQGVTLEWVSPAFRKNPLSCLLLKSGQAMQYGLALNMWGYTPVNTSSDEVLVGDRPFSSAISLRSFGTGVDSLRHQRISSSLDLGVMGPMAGGEEVQKGIHRLLDNKLPQGWQHQIKNDVILQYGIQYEKAIAKIHGVFLASAIGRLNAGTHRDNLALGLNAMVGKFDDPYHLSGDRDVEVFLYGQAISNLVGWDASLQGGLFNRESPYTIPSSDITRITLKADAGVVIRIRKLYLSHYYSFLTREFDTGRGHKWGGVRLGFIF